MIDDDNQLWLGGFPTCSESLLGVGRHQISPEPNVLAQQASVNLQIVCLLLRRPVLRLCVCEGAETN
jgi:hypothetical protein